jgi:SAM-dependent methyltransferase
LTRFEVPPKRAPLPPVELAARVGARHANDLDGFEEVGAAMRSEIVGLLPSGWSFAGKRVLDFGCGAGRTLRHFVKEAGVAEIYGCDIDVPSIEWLRSELSPPFHVFASGERPPLQVDSGSFDLVWAISVFTHLDEHWAEWLLELQRILANDGLLIATFMGRGLSQAIAREEWVEDRIGMNVLFYAQPWEQGGPMVLHSPWWLREHWGRIFDVIELREDGFVPGEATTGQGLALLRKRQVVSTVEDLERVYVGDGREIAALEHNVRQLQRESLEAREAYGRALQELNRIRGKS